MREADPERVSGVIGIHVKVSERDSGSGQGLLEGGSWSSEKGSLYGFSRMMGPQCSSR